MENQNMEAIMRNRVAEMWKTWDIRSFMIVSLLIQVLLTTLAPLRKRSSNSLLSFSLWLLYLSADAVALFTIGKISSDSGPKDPKQESIIPFWAPFLLLHLGGPDTITALVLADNELWHRHALSLATQVIITLYVFGRSLKTGYFRLLWVPTTLMLIDGCTKYIERTCALYYASSDSFRDSLRPKPEAGPNYARLVEEYSSARRAHLPMIIHGIDGPADGISDNRDGNPDSTENRLAGNSDNPESTENNNKEEDSLQSKFTAPDEDVKKVKIAYYFYNKFKGLLVDAILSLKDKKESREYFLKNKNATEFAKIVTIELHLMYDIFYTKVFLINKKLQYLRLFCFLSVVASLVLFCLEDKKNYYPIDVIITFTLLVGAIALDICAMAMFILSDWWIIITFINDRSEIIKSPMKMLYFWTKWARKPKCCQGKRSISRYNILERCFKVPPKILDYVRIKRVRDIVIGWMYVHTEPLHDDSLIEFIIEELKMKADKATDSTTHQVCSSRGNLVLQEDFYLISECLSPWTIDIDYDESLLIWHLATDICYRTGAQDAATTNHRDFSKKLSDYMLYLLLKQEGLMSPVVGISDIRFEDTCAEAQKFYKNKKKLYWSKEFLAKMAAKCNCKCWSSTETHQGDTSTTEIHQGDTSTTEIHQGDTSTTEERLLKEFCEDVLKVKSILKPIVAKGDKSKSVLFDACRLAKQLEKFKEKQWEITSKVWVELLGYAAIRCYPRSHLARLNQGGELITLVWLCMAQLGLGERFGQNQGYGWTKLIMEQD